MERKIPDLQKTICVPLFKLKEERTEEGYLEKITHFERDCEKSFIKTLSKIGTHGMVKTDPYSLPYTDEIVVNLYGESYMNGPYEFYRVARRFLKEVLDKELYKIRFYIKIDIVTERGSDVNPLFMGVISYRFRYYNK